MPDAWNNPVPTHLVSHPLALLQRQDHQAPVANFQLDVQVEDIAGGLRDWMLVISEGLDNFYVSVSGWLWMRHVLCAWTRRESTKSDTIAYCRIVTRKPAEPDPIESIN